MWRSALTKAAPRGVFSSGTFTTFPSGDISTILDEHERAIHRQGPTVRGRPLGIAVVHAAVPLPLRFAIMLEMSERVRKLLHDAMDLPVSERAGLAADLLASLDGEAEADVEAAWASEIERRAREALANPDDDIAWETVRAELLAAPTR